MDRFSSHRFCGRTFRERMDRQPQEAGAAPQRYLCLRACIKLPRAIERNYKGGMP